MSYRTWYDPPRETDVEPFPGSPDDMMNTTASLRARVAELEAALSEQIKVAGVWKRRAFGIDNDYITVHNQLSVALEKEYLLGEEVAALRARCAQLEAAARLARPYIVQATEGMDPPAPALTVLDAALAKESGK